jgi:hypothetical protein
MTRTQHGRWSAHLLGVVAAFAICALASIALAAPVNPPKTAEPAKAEPEEPAHRVLLLGATIFGTVIAPTVAYDVPWQEPFMLGRGATELERNFLKEIFRPIDRDDFLKAFPPASP